MRTDYVHRANQAIAAWIVVKILAKIASASVSSAMPISPGVALWVGAIFSSSIWDLLLVAGCAAYAHAKGRSPALGLLGFFQVPGLVVVALVPEKQDGERSHSVWASARQVPTMVLAAVILALFLAYPFSMAFSSRQISKNGSNTASLIRSWSYRLSEH